ncbi:sugar phosphate isomerase/epimerase family protein [Deinococcus sp.]|uniref:sugar phosphate isomerase/epimerase family protein n=1 Tax=Deinococcus sp. TaxID=47478 RepID=UPI003CC52C4F
MNLGFVSAILPDLDLEAVLNFAQSSGFETVELMCWPRGRAERRYAGVTHLDVDGFGAQAAEGVKALCARSGVSISALGYYPNPLVPDEAEAAVYIAHLQRVMDAAALLGVGVVTTFVGRDQTRSVADNWAVFDERWPALVRHAEQKGIKIGIENCPMLFTADEWPGGKNLATTPARWRELFERVPSAALGLNYDPSHFVWQMIDPVFPIREFAARIVHVHAKDQRLDRERLREVGIMATPLEYSEPKLPGLGDVDWSAFFAALSSAGYRGAVCVEAEDRAYEGSLADRQRGLIQSARFLRNYL